MNEETKSSLHEPRGVCVGKTAPHVELEINSEDVSHSGRILVRGPHMMLGYWGQIPTTNESVPCNGGWFDTGDIGRLDNDGNVWLIGRTNGRIKSGGENVYPEEVSIKLSLSLVFLLCMLHETESNNFINVYKKSKRSSEMLKFFHLTYY